MKSAPLTLSAVQQLAFSALDLLAGRQIDRRRDLAAGSACD